jgi:hypothetical protein
MSKTQIMATGFLFEPFYNLGGVILRCVESLPFFNEEMV